MKCLYLLKKIQSSAGEERLNGLQNKKAQREDASVGKSKCSSYVEAAEIDTWLESFLSITNLNCWGTLPFPHLSPDRTPNLERNRPAS
jgi:hypothetical protein